MRLFLSFLILAIVLTVAFACSNLEEAYEVKITNKKVQVGDMLIGIKLDSVSGSYYKIKGITPLNEYYYFNPYNLSIYLYDLTDSINDVKKRIRIPLDASINFRNVDDICYHNQDSIFVYDNSNEEGSNADLFLLNGEGAIVNSFNVFDLSQGDPMRVPKDNVFNGPTMIYHKGNMYFSALPTSRTNSDKIAPLLKYNLAKRERSLLGDFEIKIPDSYHYVQFTMNGFIDFNPKTEKIYFSYAYDSDLYVFDINKQEWKTLRFMADLFRSPDGIGTAEVIPYIQENTWFMYLMVDPRDNTVLRKLSIPNDASLPDDFDNNSMLPPPLFNQWLFKIDPNTGDYVQVSDFDLRKVRFIHPKWGPMITVQVNYDSLGLDPQDYIFFSPVDFSGPE